MSGCPAGGKEGGLHLGNRDADVLVLGGGIAGCQASLDLAAAGYRVCLVEETSAIGGVMPMLARTFPTNDCSLCILSPKLMECARHPAITLLTGTELMSLHGKPGNFRAGLKTRGRGVDVDACTACGICEQDCGVWADDEFNQGLAGRKAAYRRYPQALPGAFTIDRETCIACEACLLACPTGAIDLHPADRVYELSVGALILSPGFKLADPALAAGLHYGQAYPWVLTSLEFERLLSSSGPTRGQLVHPADGRPLASVAWLQCAASRDPSRNRGFCSSVCCMYALKQAMVAAECSPAPFTAAIFYTDMRTFGKGFDRYYRRAVDAGVRFIRCRASEVKKESDRVSIRYADEDGRLATGSFDLAVLSLGMASPDVPPVSGLGLGLNRYGFLEPAGYTAVETAQPGIFVAGAFAGPRDIPETVIQAGAAAADAAAALGPPAAGTLEVTAAPRPERPTGERPRVGVFVCACGGNISNVIDVDGVAAHAGTLPFVSCAVRFTYACGQDSLGQLKQLIAEHDLNRVVVAACSLRTHRPLFQDIVEEAGVNRYLLDWANIRDQCSWVHSQDTAAAGAKARDLVGMAVARAATLSPLGEVSTPVNRTALVVGGGVAGISAALALAGQGYPVVLAERSDRLGGIAARLRYGIRGENVPRFLAGLIARVEDNPLVTVRLKARPVENTGFVGCFTTRLSDGSSVEHGVTILATGGAEGKPPVPFGHGRDDRVLTQLELDRALTGDARLFGEPQTTVFVQCAGSRDLNRPYCSRLCCAKAVRLALEVKARNPRNQVYILYRDMMTYGFYEELYTEARERGVVFLRFREEQPPAVTAGLGRLSVELSEPTLRRPLIIEADLVCLAAPVEPGPDTAELSRLFKVPVNEDGFFLEAHMKLRPVDFTSAGVFMAGLAHGPKNIEESVAQGKAAAGRAAGILSRPEYRSGARVAAVEPERCAACLTCVRLCPFNAPRVVEGRVQIEPVLCQGCGSCAGECPAKAITLQGYPEDGFVQAVALLA